MGDFFYNLMNPLPNAVMTVIMGVLFLYWLFVFIGGIGLDDLDFGFDFDVDIDIPEIDIPDGDPDIEADTDIDTGDDAEVPAEKSPGFFIKFLNFLNVGKVPFMLILSTLKFFTWIGSLITTQLVDVSSWGAWSLIILLPLLIISIFVTKLATTPMVKFFKAIGYRGEEEIDFFGRTGKMLSTIQDDKIGTAEFIIEDNPIKLNVKSINGVRLTYGEEVFIVDETKDKKFYLVCKEINLKNFK